MLLRSALLRRLLRGSNRKRGLAPGTVVATGEVQTRAVTVSALVYTEGGCREHTGLTAADACALAYEPGVTWLTVDGVHDAHLIEELGRTFGIHKLIQEDIAHTTQRAKCEVHEGYLYLVVPMITFDPVGPEVRAEQVSLVLGDTWVVSFLEDPGDLFEPVRTRIRSGGPIRARKADYLAFSLLDIIVDHYFVALESAGDLAERLEVDVVERPDRNVQFRLNALRRELMLVRRSIWPVREAVSAFGRSESPLVHEETRPYLRDVHDHTIQAVDLAENLRELMAGLMDLYMSSISNRTNEVVKTLTIVSAIFIPLTFIAGVYGMNFDPNVSPYSMPELGWRYGYVGTLAFMALTAAIMIGWFKWRRWF